MVRCEKIADCQVWNCPHFSEHEPIEFDDKGKCPDGFVCMEMSKYVQCCEVIKERDSKLELELKEPVPA